MIKTLSQNNSNPKCFSFFDNKVNVKYPTKNVDVEFVIDYIRNNPHKATINALRMMDKSDIGYKPLKKYCPQSPSMLHGISYKHAILIKYPGICILILIKAYQMILMASSKIYRPV